MPFKFTSIGFEGGQSNREYIENAALRYADVLSVI